jgi:transcription antitermination factor NusG
MGTFVKCTPERIAVLVDGVMPATARYLHVHHVEVMCDDYVHSHNTQSNSSSNNVGLEVGRAVRVIGGSHRGNTGRIQKLTPHRVVVVLDNDPIQISRCLHPHNVEMIGLEVGRAVRVIGGSYRGNTGRIQKVTPQRVAVVLDNDPIQISHYLHQQSVQMI